MSTPTPTPPAPSFRLVDFVTFDGIREADFFPPEVAAWNARWNARAKRAAALRWAKKHPNPVLRRNLGRRIRGCRWSSLAGSTYPPRPLTARRLSAAIDRLLSGLESSTTPLPSGAIVELDGRRFRVTGVSTTSDPEGAGGVQVAVGLTPDLPTLAPARIDGQQRAAMIRALQHAVATMQNSGTYPTTSPVSGTTTRSKP